MSHSSYTKAAHVILNVYSFLVEHSFLQTYLLTVWIWNRIFFFIHRKIYKYSWNNLVNRPKYDKTYPEMRKPVPYLAKASVSNAVILSPSWTLDLATLLNGPGLKFGLASSVGAYLVLQMVPSLMLKMLNE